jgi:hypothetical protein
MHCPNCGIKASAGQKFCRACGFGLEKVEQLIVEQGTAGADQTTEAAGILSADWLRKFEKCAEGALLALCGIAISLILWAIITKVMIKEGGIFVGSMLLMLVVGVVLALFLAYLKERKNSASTPSNRQQRPTQAPETAKMLSEPNAEMAGGVTEHTTARLEEKIEAPVN